MQVSSDFEFLRMCAADNRERKRIGEKQNKRERIEERKRTGGKDRASKRERVRERETGTTGVCAKGRMRDIERKKEKERERKRKRACMLARKKVRTHQSATREGEKRGREERERPALNQPDILDQSSTRSPLSTTYT